MDIAEALEVADRWRNERVIVVGNNPLPYAVVALADAYTSQAAELERLLDQVDYTEQTAAILREEANKAESEARRLRADAERLNILDDAKSITRDGDTHWIVETWDSEFNVYRHRARNLRAAADKARGE